jgi:hypothetical protein
MVRSKRDFAAGSNDSRIQSTAATIMTTRAWPMLAMIAGFRNARMIRSLRSDSLRGLVTARR